jgi:undecaprenyl-diphosphatase
LIDFKGGLKIASAKSDGNLFVKRSSVSYWLIGIIIAAAIIGVAFYFDAPVQSFITHHRNGSLYNFMRNVSRFGDWPEHVALGLVLLAIAWWRGNKKWSRVFLAMLIALAIAGLAGRVIKISTGRARPSVKAEEVWNGPNLSSKYHAFPSGHVAASTAFFGILFLANRRLGSACLAIPIVIGFARMYVAAHYLSDVVCAAVLGILCALLVSRFVLSEFRNSQSAKL